MPPTPSRRFTIADIMILVTASAVAMVILRPYMPGHLRILQVVPSITTDRWGLLAGWMWLAGPGSCVVVPWMAALIVLRLRPPRPARPRLADQPGFVACVAVMASIVPAIAWFAAIRHRPGFQRESGFEQGWQIVTSYSATAVVGSWIALGLTRRWRPEPSWIDRMGRASGAYWVLTLLTWWAAFLMEKSLDWLARRGTT